MAKRIGLRRVVFLAVAVLVATANVGVVAHVLAQGEWTTPKGLILLCFIGTAPWLGICGGNALTGFAILLTARHPARAVLPPGVRTPPNTEHVTLRIALAVTVRHEDMNAVLPPLRRLMDGLDAAGMADQVALFVLSDSSNPILVAGEEKAVAAFRLADAEPTRVRYRRRASNDGFKAGNIMDFLDHHADGFDIAVPLDADSEMSAEAVLRLARILQIAPDIGLIQHLTVGRPADRAFPRLFQFGMRAGMRVWATGQAWWQGDEGPYWGHNAAFRIAPFRTHARLGTLARGAAILSHDQIEAARLRAAGWGVCVWVDEDGSSEANPPTLTEFLYRDTRWLAGNLQYLQLLRTPGLRWMGRWQLVQAILLFAGAPLYFAILMLTALTVALGDGAATTHGGLTLLAVTWTATIYSPKLCGYTQVLLRRNERRRYGGGWRFLAGALVEFAFTLLLDAIAQVSKTLAMLRLAAGMRAVWAPQNRAGRRVGWGEATRLLWPHTLLGVAAFALLSIGSWGAVAWALPWVGGLLIAIPFAVLSADRRISSMLARHGVAAVPEEVATTAPPRSAEVRDAPGRRTAITRPEAF